MAEADRTHPPSGPGYIVTLRGEHYHDETLGEGINAKGDAYRNRTLYGEGYVHEQLLKKLQQWEVPAHDNAGEVKVGGIGVGYATIVDCPLPQQEFRDPLGEMLTPQMANRRSGWNSAPGLKWGGGEGSGIMSLGLSKRRDKGGRRNAGSMTSALDELELSERKKGEVASQKNKRVLVNHTHFVIEFVWTPEKPRPKPDSPKGSLASTTASAVGEHSGTPSPAAAPATSATTARR